MSTLHTRWPTHDQLEFINILRRRWRIDPIALDAYVQKRFGVEMIEMDRQTASRLIDDMKGWEAVPPEILRALGQLDLFGGEAGGA